MSAGCLRRSVIACALALALPVVAAGAVAPEPAHAEPAQATAVARRSYTIAAGDLHKALNALSAQGGVQVVYAPELVVGKLTPGLSGSFTPVQALHRLLVGTGLTAHVVNASTFLLKPAAAASGSTASPKEAHKADAGKSHPKTLDAVVVSGSLINNAQIETATPTVTITADEIQNRGFDDVEDVLQNSVFSVGSVQGESHSGSFTQGAQTYKMFGLSPGYTLLLIDGRPMANFGELYNGSSSFNNVSNIPTSIVDHIDIMPGAASSIYGSSAIAGVVNIVTKSHLHGGEVSAQTSTYSEGGGASQRINFGFGHDIGKFGVLGTFQFDNRAPIWNFDRDLTRSISSSPLGSHTPTPVAELESHGTHKSYHSSVQGYLSPTDGCAAMAGLFDGSTFETANPGHPSRFGTYCGSNDVYGYQTLKSQKRSYQSMLRMHYDLNNHVRLYSDVMANYESKRWASGKPNWSSEDFPHGYVEDADTGDIFEPTRYFAPEEMGGYSSDLRMYRQNDFLTQIDLGANGNFGDSGWDWDAYFQHGSDRTRYNKPLFVTDKVDGFFRDYFLGPVVGIDSKRSDIEMFHPDYAAFYTPLTPEQYASFTQNIGGVAKSWINDTRVTLSNASLFPLPGGSAGFAALLEGGNEAWYEPVNELYTIGQVYGHTATGGGGQRKHQASAFELNLPVWRMLTLDLSGRYDHYTTSVGRANHKFTYKAGIEFRPLRTLLLRANYATAFQAPQMPAMYLGPSQSYSDAVDYYQCALAGATSCDDYEHQIKSTHMGNTQLKPTTAQSWTAGTVWAPTSRLSFNVDYLHINIQNEVTLQDRDRLLRDEAQCRLGGMDPDSVTCQMLIGPGGQVTRDADGDLTDVVAYYANLSNETTASVSAGMNYRFDVHRLGKFHVRLAYNDMLKHTYRDYPGDALIDQIRNPYYWDGFKSSMNGSISWQPSRRWSTTLYGRRQGRSPNYAALEYAGEHDGKSWLHPWITFNWSLSYKPTHDLELSFKVHNLANKMPPHDASNDDYPYYNDDMYNVYGREYTLGARLKF